MKTQVVTLRIGFAATIVTIGLVYGAVWTNAQVNTATGMKTGISLPAEISKAMAAASIPLEILNLPKREGKPLMVNRFNGIYEEMSSIKAVKCQLARVQRDLS